jgi:hypothetical protein
VIASTWEVVGVDGLGWVSSGTAVKFLKGTITKVEGSAVLAYTVTIWADPPARMVGVWPG